MQENDILKSIVHTKMENFIIPIEAIQWIIDHHQLDYEEGQNPIQDRENHYIMTNLKAWNEMGDLQKEALRLEWIQDALIIDYFQKNDIISVNINALELIWNEDEEGEYIGCELRTYYNNMGVTQNEDIRSEQEDTERKSEV